MTGGPDAPTRCYSLPPIPTRIGRADCLAGRDSTGRGPPATPHRGNRETNPESTSYRVQTRRADLSGPNRQTRRAAPPRTPTRRPGRGARGTGVSCRLRALAWHETDTNSSSTSGPVQRPAGQDAHRRPRTPTGADRMTCVAHFSAHIRGSRAPGAHGRFPRGGFLRRLLAAQPARSAQHSGSVVATRVREMISSVPSTRQVHSVSGAEVPQRAHCREAARSSAGSPTT